jgi:hypothetical protein
MQKIELDTCVRYDWIGYNNKIAKHIEEDDINNFTKWPIVSNTMHYNDSQGGDSQGAFEYLRNLPDWDKWKEAIKEVPEGNPTPNQWYPLSSDHMIHQANHISQFLSRTSCKLTDLKAIYEFGGGYGCMCRLIHNLGFSGKYTIMDLPAVQVLQKWYLGRTVKQGQLVYLLDSKEFMEQIEGGSLFIATWSLSEVSYALRDAILQAVLDKANYILIAFQGSHEELDNLAYFCQTTQQIPDYRWTAIALPNKITNRPDHFYLFGEVSEEALRCRR